MAGAWNVDTLKEHIDSRFESVNLAISKADIVAEARATKIEVETKNRFDNTNEWRMTVTDLIGKMITRAEFETAMKSVDEKIAAKNIQVFLSLAVGFIAVLIAVFNFASTH